MLKITKLISMAMLLAVVIISCTQEERINPQLTGQQGTDPSEELNASARMGALITNGWYEGEEIYYIDLGVEEGVTERGENQIYLIGGNRKFQANVVLFIPGEAGYTPHWNVNVVTTAAGVTVEDILASGYASEHFDDEGVLFDDVEDIYDAADAGLIVIAKPGVVVNCPIVSEKTEDAPGNREASEDFEKFVLNEGF